MTHVELLLRILVGTILGGMIGYERDRHGRPAGLRTHAIVALAAATFMVISTRFVYFQHYRPGDLVEVDTSRIAASVVSAIGFLAGGAILRNGLSIQGLTTAAGLWLVTAIGMAAGAAMYVEAIAVTSMGLVALTVLRRFEDKDDARVRRRVEVVVAGDAQDGDAITDALAGVGAIVLDLEYERRFGDERRAVWSIDVSIPATLRPFELGDALAGIPDVERIQVQAPR